MSDHLNETYSDEDLGDAENLGDPSNSASSDSASTFEYVEQNLSPEKPWESRDIVAPERDSFSPIETIEHDDVLAARPLACASTKEEKQRHNEEIVVMESASASSESWESMPLHEKHSEVNGDVKDNCRLFLRNERRFGFHDNTSLAAKPSSSSKPCFIDASSLLDDEDLIYTPPPSVCHKAYNAVNLTQLQKSFEVEDKDDEASGIETVTLPFNDYNKFDEELKPKVYDIKDQFAAADRPAKTASNGRFLYDDEGSSRDNEKHQGSLIFQHSIPQYSGHLLKQHDDNYTSDMSIQSYSSYSGEPKEVNDYGTASMQYNSLCENTSDYNSGYSRIQSDSDSIVLPETPFNSIVQVSRQLKIFEASDDIDGIDEQAERRLASIPMKIPKRSMKYDELAPVLSGGASVKDFTPKQCESPSVRRRTDTCPIVSGGSVDLEEIEVKPKKNDAHRPSTASQSWVVDFNELRIHESDEKLERQPKSLDYSSSLGFYVDFNSLEESDQPKSLSETQKVPRKVEKPQSDEKNSKKSTGFYVDFSDNSRPETPKQVPSASQPKPKVASSDKKNMFSMFIDFNEGKKPEDVAAPVAQKIEKPPIERMSSKDSQDDEKEKEKKGCYMFIESDSPVVRRRNLISKSDTKRHSWNVNPQEQTEAQKSAKSYQRSTSVTNDKGMMNILEKIPILSKTSSMSIDSSVSPYEDFSCSKSFSSYSNNSATTSNSSLDKSGTKVILLDEAMTQSAKKRRKDAKLNETFDKSSQGSVTEGILSNDDSQASSTDTDDLTFQNNEQEETQELRKDLSIGDFKTKMETIPETAESSPLKKISAPSETAKKESEVKIETYTMESLQALIEKQKQILETVTEPSSSVSFVKLSDLDKPPPVTSKHFENISMSNSAGARVSRLFYDTNIHAGHRSLTLQTDSRNNIVNMSRSTGNNFANLASSVENSRSLSRLFPHLSKGEFGVDGDNDKFIVNVNVSSVISSSVPSNVGFNSDQSFYEHLEFISSDFSCTSSVTSSRSGMGEFKFIIRLLGRIE